MQKQLWSGQSEQTVIMSLFPPLIASKEIECRGEFKSGGTFEVIVIDLYRQVLTHTSDMLTISTLASLVEKELHREARITE